MILYKIMKSCIVLKKTFLLIIALILMSFLGCDKTNVSEATNNTYSKSEKIENIAVKKDTELSEKSDKAIALETDISTNVNIENQELNENNYKEIILSLCKKENTYDYLLTESMKNKKDEGIIDFNRLKDPLYETIEIFDTVNYGYYDNYKHHIVTITINSMNDEGLQDTNYYTLKYYRNEEDNKISNVVIINQTAHWAGLNLYAPEYYYFNQEDETWVNRNKIINIINGFDINYIKLGATDNLRNKYPDYENIGFLPDKNYIIGGAHLSIDYEKLKSLNISEYDIICCTMNYDTTKWYKIIPIYYDDLLDDLKIELILEEKSDNKDEIENFEQCDISPYYEFKNPRPAYNYGFFMDYNGDPSHNKYIKSISEYDKNCVVDAINIVVFGKFEQDNDLNNGKECIEWIPVAKEDDKVLLVSKNVLFTTVDQNQIAVNNDDFALETHYYEKSFYREYLNGSFYNECFNDYEKSKILVSSIENFTNNNDSSLTYKLEDKIFMLSKLEIEKYFMNNKQLYTSKCTDFSLEPNEQFREIFGDSVLHVFTGFDDEDKWYFGNASYRLRDYFDYSYEYSCVNQYYVDGSGDISYSDVIPPHAGVRPAMWVSIK